MDDFARGVAAHEARADATAVSKLRANWSAAQADVATLVETSFADGREERVLLAALRDELRDEARAVLFRVSLA